MGYLHAWIYLISGLIVITITDTLGSVASRKFNFRYASLTFLSVGIYICFGCITCIRYDLVTALWVNGLLGLFDGTVGLYLSIILGANTGLDKKKSLQHVNMTTAVSMIIFACLLVLPGYGLSKFY